MTTVEVEADLTLLRSAKAARDAALRRQALETDTFPTAHFALAEPIELPAGAADGEPVVVTAVGDLTLHGFTRRVEVPLEVQLVEGTIAAVGSLPVRFEDYGIERPRAAVVLSVDDNGVMELQLLFAAAG